MAAKIAAFLTTFILALAAGAVIFLFMIITMNGYSESDATYGIVAYLALSFTLVVLLSSAAAFLVHILMKRGYSGAVAAVIAITVFSLIAFVCEAISAGVAVGVAEFVRVNF